MAPVPPPGAPPALSAFLHGVGRRALLFAVLHSGEGPAVDAALASAIAGFAAEAEGMPMGRWPAAFWRRLLATLPRPQAAADASGPATAPAAPAPVLAGFPGLAALPAQGSGARVALLLALVAGLDEEDGGAALDADAATWRLALRRAAPRDAEGRFDEAAWRALATAARDAQRALPDTRLAWWERACDAALAARGGAAAAAATRDPRGHRGLVRVLWAAVAACAVGLAATFVPWNAPRVPRDGAHPARADAVPLAPAAAPARRYDEAFALQNAPDLPRLLAGADALLRELDFGAWYAARIAANADVRTDAQADAQAEAHADVDSAAAAAADPYQPGQLPSLDAMSPAQRAQLLRRVEADRALPRAERSVLRERWEAWRRMPATERARVRRALASFARLPADARRPLRDAFAAQSIDLQRGWLLGPTLGERWPRLQPLLQQVPATERESLLARLHAMDSAALDALALLAQRTPPQERDALRKRLMAGRGS